ncbi:MAG: glycosyltransferase [Phormidesmis sp.]
MIKISVLTLTRNRSHHLKNLLKGLAHSSRLPDECIVVHMNEAAHAMGTWPFSCEHYAYSHPQELPLAAARNAAACHAAGDILIFLDVDCIPAREMVAEYEKACQQVPQAIAMGNVHYLSHTIRDNWTEDQLLAQSTPHPKRDITAVAALTPENNYGLFWSLSFALHRPLFDQLGGFSEIYPGYGAEDTDFAWKVKAQGIELRWVPQALAFHQFHTSTVPPWQHLTSIVHNASIFYERWGEWPMGGWLSVFAEEGYIDWDRESDHIAIIRLPALAAHTV